MKKIRPFWWAVMAVVVLGIGAYMLFGDGDDGITYRFESVDRGEIVVGISATGTLNAVTTVQVGSQVSGTIAKLYVDFNSQVTQGQLLAQLDPTFLQASLNEQRANLDRATAQVNEAGRNHARTSELSGKSLVSQAEMDAAVTTLESARAGLKQAQAAVERAEVNLRYATIRAPISGVVVSRNVDVGQTVAASLQAPTLFSIANDLRKMQVEASVDEADIGNVRIGQSVGFRVDAYPEQQFAGRVSQIRLAPVVTQNVVTYTVIIAVNNPEQKLMPGMTATVSIEVSRREDALRIPVMALRFTPPEEPGTSVAGGAVAGQERRQNAEGVRRGPGEEADRTGGGRAPRPAGTNARVWILQDGKPSPVRVLRGVQNTRYAELLDSGLKEGDRVIVGMLGGTAQQGVQGQTNPLMPRMPGGGGRRGM